MVLSRRFIRRERRFPVRFAKIVFGSGFSAGFAQAIRRPREPETDSRRGAFAALRPPMRVAGEGVGLRPVQGHLGVALSERAGCVLDMRVVVRRSGKAKRAATQEVRNRRMSCIGLSRELAPGYETQELVESVDSEAILFFTD